MLDAAAKTAAAFSVIDVAEIWFLRTVVCLVYLLGEVIDRAPQDVDLSLCVVHTFHRLGDNQHLVLHVVSAVNMGQEIVAPPSRSPITITTVAAARWTRTVTYNDSTTTSLTPVDVVVALRRGSQPDSHDSVDSSDSRCALISSESRSLSAEASRCIAVSACFSGSTCATM